MWGLRGISWYLFYILACPKLAFSRSGETCTWGAPAQLRAYWPEMVVSGNDRGGQPSFNYWHIILLSCPGFLFINMCRFSKSVR
jgi:hypothetical protein